MGKCEMPLARRVSVVGNQLRVRLQDGRMVARPLRWYPIINLAPRRMQRRVRVTFAGTGIAWPDLGYELGVGGLVRQRGPLKF